MDDTEKDYYVSWIVSDYTPFEFDGRDYFLATPSRENRFLAERFFVSTYESAIADGLLDDIAVAKLLYKHSLWDQDKENQLNKLVNDIEDIKVWIYENYSNTIKWKKFKQSLRDTENLIGEMLLSKQAFDGYAAKSVAQLAKQHFLLGSSIYKRKNKPLFRDWWRSHDDEIVQHCYNIISDYYLSDHDYRELARSNQWRNIWASRKSVGNLFGRAVVDFSLQQRQLVMWSNIYDSVYKSSQCPADSVIEDDDTLDGWMIKQRRERNKQDNKSLVERGLTNNKIRNSDQVYIMCDPTISDTVIVDDPSKVYECNDVMGKMRWNRIMNQIKQEGCVNYMGLKDTQTEIMRKAGEMR